MKSMIIAIALLLGGCQTTEQYLIEQQSRFNREQIDIIVTRAQCKALARNLVQIARCDPR